MGSYGMPEEEPHLVPHESCPVCSFLMALLKFSRKLALLHFKVEEVVVLLAVSGCLKWQHKVD